MNTEEYPQTIKDYLYFKGIKGAIFLKNNQLYSIHGLEMKRNEGFVIVNTFNRPGHLFQVPLKNILEEKVIAIEINVKSNLAVKTQTPIEETAIIPPLIEEF
ncbi:hypothetical protein DRN73_01990 [Candidatus Pacearchaeota archaeon]|nr:MAG: hypothetical protein DRN73_01990 [Candidatus Pacearchaeota archaeon]